MEGRALDPTHSPAPATMAAAGLLWIALSFAPWAHGQDAAPETGAAYTVELDAPAELQALLNADLSVIRLRGRETFNPRQLRHLASQADAEARELLATEGYFSPRVESSVAEAPGGRVVSIRVDPGERTRIERAEVRVTGHVSTTEAGRARVAQLIRDWSLGPGRPFRQTDWDGAKSRLLKGLLLDLYPAARIARSEARVDPAAGTAVLFVEADSGPPFHFGELEVRGLERYPRQVVENLNPVAAGQPYRQEDLVLLQTRLQDSGYFQSAFAGVDPDPARAEAVPVVVTVVEFPKKKIDLGVGYSTDTGARVSGGWTTNSVFGTAWQLHADAALETRKQSASLQLRMPPEPRGYQNRFTARIKRTDISGLLTDSRILSAGRFRRTDQRETDYVLQYDEERQTPDGGSVDYTRALSANVAWTARRVDNIFNPTAGVLVNLQLGAATKALLSDQNFVRTYGKAVWLHPATPKDTLELRGELGIVFAPGRDGIPNDYLFRAGGDQSIRSYAYQSLGVVQDGATVGGRYLGVATVEYRRTIYQQWGAALFVDAGNAADSTSEFEVVYGYGAGLRMNTPAGSVNLDVARASTDGKYRMHLTVGVRF